MNATTLSSALRLRRFFDPSKKDDVAELKFFVLHNKWKNGCPFFQEKIWSDIPTMCTKKYMEYHFGKPK